MRTLLLTDLHFNAKPKGLLEAQKKCVLDIFRKESPNEVILMGDIFMHRKPIPRELLAFKDVILEMGGSSHVYLLRGNHDSETKADDGVTSLSLFEEAGVEVITHTWIDEVSKRVFIPHYEDEEIIKKALEEVPIGYTVFGHFGYGGSLNSAGDADFSIPFSSFNNITFLGHVHRHNKRGKVTIVGTPYTTDYHEAGKTNYYAILDDGGPRTKTNVGWISSEGETYIVEFKPIEHGPRHLMFDLSNLQFSKDFINDSKYFNLVRVYLDELSDTQKDLQEFIEDLDIGYLDVKYRPVFDEKEELSNYSPSETLFSIDDSTINSYVEDTNSTLTKETLLEGLKLLRDEN